MRRKATTHRRKDTDLPWRATLHGRAVVICVSFILAFALFDAGREFVALLLGLDGE